MPVKPLVQLGSAVKPGSHIADCGSNRLIECYFLALPNCRTQKPSVRQKDDLPTTRNGLDLHLHICPQHPRYRRQNLFNFHALLLSAGSFTNQLFFICAEQKTPSSPRVCPTKLLPEPAIAFLAKQVMCPARCVTSGCQGIWSVTHPGLSAVDRNYSTKLPVVLTVRAVGRLGAQQVRNHAIKLLAWHVDRLWRLPAPVSWSLHQTLLTSSASFTEAPTSTPHPHHLPAQGSKASPTAGR